MFFSKKKSKSKIRFENKEFASKVKQARNFKRKSAPVSNTAYSQTMKKFGLSSWWSQVLAFLAIAALVYLIYMPNFLSFDKIEIIGADGSESTVLAAEIKSVISDNSALFPKSNLVFVQSGRIKNKLLSNSEVYAVNSIKRNFHNQSLEVNVTLKYEKFLLLSDNKVYDIYNDGTIKGLAGLVSQEQWLREENQNMIKLKFDQPIPDERNLPFLSQEMVAKLDEFNNSIESIIDQVVYIELRIPTISNPGNVNDLIPVQDGEPVVVVDENVNPTLEQSEEVLVEPNASTASDVQQIQLSLPVDLTELIIVLPRSKTEVATYGVQVAVNQEAKIVTDKLFLLLSQMNPDRFASLAYIDMRIESKAFICLINTPCAK